MLDNKLRILKKRNKKATVGEAMTWFIATIIIVFILLTFLYVSSLMGKAKILTPDYIRTSASGTERIQVKTLLAKQIKLPSDIAGVDEWISKEELSNG